MRLLLDTHAFLWYVSDDPKLSPSARAAISDPDASVSVSLVTMWEIAIKYAKGRLALDEPPDVFTASEMLKNRFLYLPLRAGHVFVAAALPQNDHKDPFDRALVAQAKVEGMVLVSADEKLDAYGGSRLF